MDRNSPFLAKVCRYEALRDAPLLARRAARWESNLPLIEIVTCDDDEMVLIPNIGKLVSREKAHQLAAVANEIGNPKSDFALRDTAISFITLQFVFNSNESISILLVGGSSSFPLNIRVVACLHEIGSRQADMTVPILKLSLRSS